MLDKSLYVCDDYHLMIYETEEKATLDAAVPATCPQLDVDAAYWSKRLKCKVTYSNPKEPIFVISEHVDCWHVIIGEKIGWINYRSWTGIRKLTK